MSKYLLLIAVLFLSSCRDSERSSADAVIAKIEDFKKTEGRLPENLSEVGFSEDEGGPIYFEKKSVDSYIVWYGTALGESETYTSSDKSWR